MKKIIAVLLILTIISNAICFGFGFNIVAGAELITAVGAGILALVGGYVIGGLSGIFGDAVADYANNYSAAQMELLYSINSNGIENGEVIEVYQSGNNPAFFRPVDGLEGEEAEFAEYFCNRLNNSEYIQDYVNGYYSKYNEYLSHDPDMEFYYEMSAEQYSNIKSECVNAFTQFLAKEGMLEDIVSGAQALAEAGDFPLYVTDDDFNGPIDPLNSIVIDPNINYVSINKDGISFQCPQAMGAIPGQFLGEEINGFYGFEFVKNNRLSNGLYGHQYNHKPSNGVPIYGYGFYLIYQGVIYRNITYGLGKENAHTTSLTIMSNNSDIYDLNKYVDSFGNYLVDTGIQSTSGCSGGYYVFTCPKSQREADFISVSENEFQELSGGGTINAPPLDDYENIINQAFAAGLLPEDFMLKLNELGQIMAANNIPIEQLNSLLEQLKDGQLHFEDFESYLQYISALLSAGNIDRQTSARILNNIRALQEQTNNNIGVLNTTISGLRELDEERNDALARIDANIAALTEALTAEAEEDIVKESTDLDAVVGNHIGLSEANQFVSNWALMNQFKGLLYNVLDRYDDAGSEPPNFNFYWDSNKDGEAEKYTFLDLSILETTLDNSNLEDKERFKNSMTIREFIQLLIILVCYVAFIIKMLRKLPGLVSGGESSMDTGFELTKAQNEHTARVLRSVHNSKGE